MGSTDGIIAQGPRRPTLEGYQHMVVTMVAGLVLIAGGALTIWEARRSPPAVPAPAPPTVSRPLTDELLGTTKALQATQQETIDQLQVVQDQLAAQKLETKKLADEIAEITEKLAVVQSNLPAASSTSVVLTKPHH
jgi:uncharacterized coiled-coil protein SlyX